VSSNVADRSDEASPTGQTSSSSPPTTDLRRRPLSLKSGLFVLFVTTLWSGNSIAIKAGLRARPQAGLDADAGRVRRNFGLGHLYKG